MSSAPPQAELAAPIVACAQGKLPVNVALALLIAAADSAQSLGLQLAAARDSFAEGRARNRVVALLELWQRTPAAWNIVRNTLRSAHVPAAASAAQWAAAFDRASAVSADAAAAVYCLGRADLLAAATRSLVRRLRDWGLLGPERAVLDLGCGPGRLARALAPLTGSVVGIDVSAGMLAAARARCRALGNVSLVKVNGRDLAAFAAASFDLIVAVDVFPYLVACNADVAGRHVADARRLLRRRGSLVIVNFAYGYDEASERAEAARLAAAHGFDCVRFGSGDFALWDGRTFHLRRG